MSKGRVLFTSLLLLLATTVTATEVIIMVYPGRILLAADSKISYLEKSGNRISTTGCKIFEVNNTVYAYAGYGGSYGNYAATGENFNTQNYIKSILGRRDRSLLQNLRDLKKGLAEELTREFTVMEKVNRRKYVIEKQKGNPLTLAVLGNNNAGPFLCAFVATFKNNTVEVKDYVYQNLTDLVYFGASLEVAKYHKTHPLLLKDEPVSLMDKLMTLAINDKPSEIGKPVNIVEVTSKGINWIRKSSCSFR